MSENIFGFANKSKQQGDTKPDFNLCQMFDGQEPNYVGGVWLKQGKKGQFLSISFDMDRVIRTDQNQNVGQQNVNQVQNQVQNQGYNQQVNNQNNGQYYNQNQQVNSQHNAVQQNGVQPVSNFNVQPNMNQNQVQGSGQPNINQNIQPNNNLKDVEEIPF